MAIKKQSANISDISPEDLIEDPLTELPKKTDINLIRYTKNVDSLVIQNKQLKKELEEAEDEIFDLENKLDESFLKIPKNMVYAFLLVFGIATYLILDYTQNLTNKITELNTIIIQYKIDNNRKLDNK